MWRNKRSVSSVAVISVWRMAKQHGVVWWALILVSKRIIKAASRGSISWRGGISGISVAWRNGINHRWRSNVA